MTLIPGQHTCNGVDVNLSSNAGFDAGSMLGIAQSHVDKQASCFSSYSRKSFCCDQDIISVRTKSERVW